MKAFWVKDMRRREFIGLIGGAATAWPLSARGQSSAKILRVATANVNPRSAPQWAAFLQRLAELGYKEDDNLIFDHLQISSTDTWLAGYREVVARKPDILVAAGPEISLKAAVASTDSLPIVMIAVDYNPLAKGYVKSLSSPAGNISGVYLQGVELVGKRLQLLKQAFPDVTALTVFWDQSSTDYWDAVQPTASQLGLKLTGVEFSARPYNYERAAGNPQAGSFLYAVGSPFFFLDRALLAEFAIRNRLLSMSDLRESVAAGNLISYGPPLPAMFVLAANYVDRIAKGAKTADLPVEQPTKFELAVNLKTAKAIGIDLPATLLARADDVIE